MKVRADSLLLAFSQVAILEGLTSGMARYDAITEAWAMSYRLTPEKDIAQDRPLLVRLHEEMREASLRRDFVEFDRLNKVWDEITSATIRWSRNCLARSAEINKTLLQTPEAEGVEFDSVELQRVVWLLECVRRVSEGQPFLEAARAAYDASLNKPKQKRKPVENDWLAEQVTASLDAIWVALCAYCVEHHRQLAECAVVTSDKGASCHAALGRPEPRPRMPQGGG
jgi:hypothetical protein